MFSKLRISEVGLKLQLGDILSDAERFRILDEDVLPVELDQLKDSYQYVIKMLAQKSNEAVKNKNLCDRYREQYYHEIKEITKLEREAAEFEHALQMEHGRGKTFATKIKDYEEQPIQHLLSTYKPPKDVEEAFQAFLQLGPIGTQGGADVSWDTIKELLKDQEKLYYMMISMLDERIKNVSRAEIDNAAQTKRHLCKEFSTVLPHHCHSFAKLMINFVDACLSIWDLNEAKQARNEMAMLKKEKLDFIRKEYLTYQEIGNLLEKEIDEIYHKYEKSKHDYLILKKEAERADELMFRFQEHYKEMEVEKNKRERNYFKITQLLDVMKKDVDEFEIERIRIQHKFPGNPTTTA